MYLIYITFSQRVTELRFWYMGIYFVCGVFKCIYLATESGEE